VAKPLELGKKLKQHGVQFSLVQNERLSGDVVTQYLNVNGGNSYDHRPGKFIAARAARLE